MDKFEAAFNHVMLYEVGAFWDPKDADVINGNCSTRDQRRKVGYVNAPADHGGETKYGVAQNANPNVDVKALTLKGAMDVYFTCYWLRGKCDQLPASVSLIHFDGCINHGIGRANRFLQRAVGVQDDGVVGPVTIGKINEADPVELIKSIADQRAKFCQAIVQRDPSQGVFLKGWLRRINEVRDFTLQQLA
jgi:lysozyme family protein